MTLTAERERKYMVRIRFLQQKYAHEQGHELHHWEVLSVTLSPQYNYFTHHLIICRCIYIK